MTELTVKELSAKVIEGGITQEQIQARHEELKSTSFLYKTPNGLRMALMTIAKENKISIGEAPTSAVGEVFPLSIEGVYEGDKKKFSIKG